MTITQLKKCLNHAKEHGLSSLHLSMETPESLKRGNLKPSVKSVFGMVRWYPSSRDGHILIYPSVEQVAKYISKVEGA